VARNLGASAASGEYFAFLDDDDLLFPWALGTYDKVIRSCGEPALVVSHLREFSGASPLCEISETPSEAEYVVYPTYLVKDRTVRASASMMVVHRSAFEQAGGFQNGGFDDVDFLLKVSGAGPAVLILSPRTVAYRWHGANAVRDMERAFRGVRYLIRTERAGGYQGVCPRRFDRYAFLGGPVFFWSKKALRLGFPLMALRVLIPGMPMVLAGGLRRGMRRITGCRQPDRVKLGRDAPSE
jgi:GT2 family glycosyltransferase